MHDTDLTRLLSDTGVTNLRHFETIGSTNTEALNWAESGALDFSLVIAEEQTSGRGRFDRNWVTQRGSSLAFSLILCPSEAEKSTIALLAPLCGIAVQSAVATVAQLEAEIKWPNDVLINRKKFCGILVEAAWREGQLRGVVLGIGINVNVGSVPPNASNSFPATCLQEAAGKPIDRFALLHEILLAIGHWRSKLGTDDFIERWQRKLAFKDEWVRVEHADKSPTIGKVAGISPSGELVLLDENGAKINVMTGDVRLRPMTHNNDGVQHA